MDLYNHVFYFRTSNKCVTIISSISAVANGFLFTFRFGYKHPKDKFSETQGKLAAESVSNTKVIIKENYKEVANKINEEFIKQKAVEAYNRLAPENKPGSYRHFEIKVINGIDNIKYITSDYKSGKPIEPKVKPVTKLLDGSNTLHLVLGNKCVTIYNEKVQGNDHITRFRFAFKHPSDLHNPAIAQETARNSSNFTYCVKALYRGNFERQAIHAYNILTNKPCSYKNFKVIFDNKEETIYKIQDLSNPPYERYSELRTINNFSVNDIKPSKYTRTIKPPAVKSERCSQSNTSKNVKYDKIEIKSMKGGHIVRLDDSTPNNKGVIFAFDYDRPNLLFTFRYRANYGVYSIIDEYEALVELLKKKQQYMKDKSKYDAVLLGKPTPNGIIEFLVTYYNAAVSNEEGEYHGYVIYVDDEGVVSFKPKHIINADQINKSKISKLKSSIDNFVKENKQDPSFSTKLAEYIIDKL